MAQIKSAALDYELKRWMRPDWRRYWRPGQDDDPLYRLYDRIEHKYSPDQPRVPAGSSEGGQWTSGGVGGGSSGGATGSSPNVGSGKVRIRIGARISRQREQECEIQYRQDTFICNTVGTRFCWEQAAFRRAQCLRGLYIPPLYF